MAKYTLHEAMQMVLSAQPNWTAATQVISDEIWKRRLYRQKKGRIADKTRIAARARRYPKLFEKVAPQILRLRVPYQQRQTLTSEV